MEPRLRADIPRMTPDAAFIDRLAAVAASAPPVPAATVGPRRVLAIGVAAASVAAILAGVAYAAHDRSDGLPPAHPTPVVRPSYPIPTPAPRPTHPDDGQSGNAQAPGTEAPVTTGVAAASTGNEVHPSSPSNPTPQEPAEPADAGTSNAGGDDGTSGGDSPTRSGSDDPGDSPSDDASDTPTPDPTDGATDGATDGSSDPSSPDAVPDSGPSPTPTPTSNG